MPSLFWVAGWFFYELLLSPPVFWNLLISFLGHHVSSNWSMNVTSFVKSAPQPPSIPIPFPPNSLS